MRPMRTRTDNRPRSPAKAATYPREALERILDYSTRRADPHPLVTEELARLPLADRRGPVRLYGPFVWTAPPGWPHDHQAVAALLVDECEDPINEAWRLNIRPVDDLFTAHDRWTLATAEGGRMWPVPGWPTAPIGEGRCQGCGRQAMGWFCDSYCEGRAAWWKTAPVRRPALPAVAIGPSIIEPPTLTDPIEIQLADARCRKAQDAATIAALRSELAAARAELETARVDFLRRRMGKVS